MTTSMLSNIPLASFIIAVILFVFAIYFNRKGNLGYSALCIIGVVFMLCSFAASIRYAS